MLLLSLAACSGYRAPDAPDTTDLAWPPDTRRVQLERVITTRRDIGRGSLARWISGRPDPGLFQRPYDIDWDGESLLVTDPGARRIVRLGPGKRLVFSPAGTFDSPIGVAVCQQGVVVTDSIRGEVTLLDSDLRPRRQLVKDLVRPSGVTCDATRIFVAETGRHRLLVLDGANLSRPPGPAVGDSLQFWGRRGDEGGQFNYPTALEIGRGVLWVADTLNFRIQKLDLESGSFLDAWGKLGDSPGETPRIKGLALDAGGYLWVSDAHLDQLAIYQPDGRFMLALGGTGYDPGRFSFPAGLAAHADGRVAMVDSLNRRLQIFRQMAPGASGTEG